MYSIVFIIIVTTFKINKNLTNPKLEGWCKMYFTEYSLEQHEGEWILSVSSELFPVDFFYL